MNNRQKAKHFKRKYEALLKPPVQPMIIDEKHITTLKIKKVVPNDIIRASEWSPEVDIPLNGVVNEMADELAKEILHRIPLVTKTTKFLDDCTELEAEIHFYE